MRYTTNIDIMFGNRFDSTVRNYTVDSFFGRGRMLEDMLSHIYKAKPYLRRRREFDLFFKNGEGKDIHLTIKPKKNYGNNN